MEYGSDPALRRCLYFARRNPENLFFGEDDSHPTLHSFTNNGRFYTRGRIIYPDELPFVVRPSRRISKESSSKRIMRDFLNSALFLLLVGSGPKRPMPIEKFGSSSLVSSIF